MQYNTMRYYLLIPPRFYNILHYARGICQLTGVIHQEIFLLAALKLKNHAIADRVVLLAETQAKRPANPRQKVPSGTVHIKTNVRLPSDVNPATPQNTGHAYGICEPGCATYTPCLRHS